MCGQCLWTKPFIIYIYLYIRSTVSGFLHACLPQLIAASTDRRPAFHSRNIIHFLLASVRPSARPPVVASVAAFLRRPRTILGLLQIFLVATKVALLSTTESLLGYDPLGAFSSVASKRFCLRPGSRLVARLDLDVERACECPLQPRPSQSHPRPLPLPQVFHFCHQQQQRRDEGRGDGLRLDLDGAPPAPHPPIYTLGPRELSRSAVRSRVCH